MSYVLKSTNMIPTGGWLYVEPETGVRFKGGSFADTVAFVTKHRVANSLPRTSETEVRQDIENQICQRVGHEWCEHMKSGQWGFSIDFDKVKAGTRSIWGWAKALLTGQDPYVDEVEATRRADICSKCWANQAIAGCYGCGLRDQIAEMVTEVKGSRRTKYDDKLHACLVCGCDNSVQVWIRADILADAATPHQQECYAEIPGCWKASLQLVNPLPTS